jgi:hypothetical protein
MRLSTSIAGIVAGIAMGFLATSSRADFNLTVTDTQGDGFTVKDVGGNLTYTPIGNAPTSNPFTGNASSFSGTVKIDGYNLAVTATGNATSGVTGSESLSITESPATTNPAKTTFTYSMGETVTKTTNPLTLSTSLSTSTNSANNTVKSQGSYSSGSFTTSTKTLNLTGSNASDSDVKNITVKHSTPSNQLGLNGTFAVGKNSHIGFTAKVSAMPEPAGLLTFAIGLPCMAGVVFLVRRRSVKMPALA